MSPLFHLFAALALFGGIGVVVSRNPVSSAFSMILSFIGLASLFIQLDAYLVGVLQILVYAGAIMVLFLFVIMLLGAEQLQAMTGVHGSERYHRAVAIVLVVLLVGGFGYLVTQGGMGSGGETAVIDASPVALGLRLFEGYVLPFEVTGVLLLAAIIGVAVFTRRKKKEA